MSSKYIKQSVVLFISSAFCVILGVGVSVLNTSLLTPLEYGNFRYVTNMLNFFASLLLFGYFVSGSRCLALSNTQTYNRQIRGVMVIILAIATCAMIGCMLGCYITHLLWIDYSVASLFLVSTPICSAPLLLNYVNTVFQGDNSIYKLSLARIMPSIAYLVLAIFIFSQYKATASSLLLLQNGIAIIILIVLIFSSQPSFKNIQKAYSKLKQENRTYGFNVYIGSIAAVSLNYIAGITLGIFGGDNTNVGFYTLALTIATPLSILPTVIGTTHFKKFASQNFINHKVISITFLLSIGSLLIYILTITPIVDLLYDKSYHCVAQISQFLAIGSTMHGLGDMFNRFLGAHGKGKELRNGAFLCGLTMVVGNIVLVYFFDINGAIWTRILSAMVYCSTMWYYYIQFVKLNNKSA